MVYDINAECINDRINDRATTEQRPSNDKQEGIRKKKKEKEDRESRDASLPSLPKKIKFRELVELTQTQHDSLLAKHGPEFLEFMLNFLDSKKGSNGYTYDSDFHTMKEGGWVIREARKAFIQQNKDDEKSNKHAQGEQLRSVTQPSKTEFQPRRVLRGTNDGGSLDQGGANE
jgi:hypothetical protein